MSAAPHLIAVLLACLCALPVHAQFWPSKPRALGQAIRELNIGID